MADVSMDVLVLLNSGSPAYREGRELLLPYLEHLGVPCRVLDLNHCPLPADTGRYALVVAAHGQLDPGGNRLGIAGRRTLLAAVAAGSGMVTFDPALPTPAELGEEPEPGAQEAIIEVDGVELADPAAHHTVTAPLLALDIAPFFASLALPPMAAEARSMLLRAGGRPLLAAKRLGDGRVARWATARWLGSRILGPLAGLDRTLWRSLAWAARKPFALRGLPPLVTMRVDDVVGLGAQWDRSALYWVHDANATGFRPWLGLNIYNLPPTTVAELRDLILEGRATAFPHSFGRPPLAHAGNFYYYERAIGLRGDHQGFIYADEPGRPWPSDLDEFIYFDHHHGWPWSDAEAARGLAAVDEWYASHAPLPMSRYALPHFYECGSNVVAHVHDRWGADLVGTPADIDTPFVAESPWLKLGPFRRYEEPGTCSTMDPTRRGSRPLYYADMVNLGGYLFFNCLTEVRDVAGFEWSPDNDVVRTVRSGVRQLRRALDSMALAVLFTHETDHIYEITPDNWRAEVVGVAAGIADYDPIYVAMDDGVRYVRATRTSRLVSCTADQASGEIAARFEGSADVATHFRLFTEADDELVSTLVDVPAFDGAITVTHRYPGSRSASR